jgi:hypothetical protein
MRTKVDSFTPQQGDRGLHLLRMVCLDISKITPSITFIELLLTTTRNCHTFVGIVTDELKSSDIVRLSWLENESIDRIVSFEDLTHGACCHR